MTGTITDLGASSTVERISRYPGVKPFGDDEIQRQLFRGREDEKYELLQLVLAERLVLIFARSGIGKSSLINAGLLEPMRDRGYFPAVVRLSGKGEHPLDCLYEGMRAAVDEARERGEVECEPPEPDWNKTSLWHFFKTLELWQNDRLLSPVLVIDQFEELFTLHSVERRKQFIHELADLVRGTRPREKSDDSGQKLGETPPEVRVVLSLREDFYANLEELRDRIPSIYKAPFRLKPLTRQQAERAIVEPAELQGGHFWTPPFAWSNEALKDVLDFLSEQQVGGGKTKVGKEVEPFQLQLLCQHVEGKVRQEKLKTIAPDDLGGREALKVILSSFYEDTLRKTCERFPKQQGLREKLERLCEYGFITSRGRRLLREESTIKQDDGVGPEVLRELVEFRLLRIEPRVGDNYYELTHDTLIAPIQLSRQAREERKARAVQAEQRKRRKQLMAAGAFATFVVIATGTWALLERAATQRERAETQVALDGKRKALAETQVALDGKRKALAETQVALGEKEKAEDKAELAALETTEEVARRELAEAEAELARIEPVAVASQKKLAEVEQQLADAEGEDQREQGERLVAEWKARYQEDRRKFEKAQQAVFEAKKGLTLAEGTRAVTEVQKLEGTGETGGRDNLVEQKESGTGVVMTEPERQAEIPGAGLDDVATPESEPTVLKVEIVELEAKTKLKKGAKVELAALEFRESESEITDRELANKYREFLNAHGNNLGVEEVQKIKNKMNDIEQAADIFADHTRKDEDPNFSLCEALDQWTTFVPRRPLGPEAKHRDLRLAELNAMFQNSAVVSTQENFITSNGEKDLVAKSVFGVGNGSVYAHMWVNSPRIEALKLKLRQGDVETVIWGGGRKKVVVKPNPLRGFQMGYHLWSYKGANAVGEYEFLLYNANDKLICRREYKVI